MPVQLKIQDIRTLKIDFALLQPEGIDAQSVQPEEQKVDFTLNFRAEHSAAEPESTLKVIQGIHVKGERLPFYIKAEIGGIFLIEGVSSEDELDRITNINCNGILFPYLRELVSDISKRGGLAPLFLPPVNFVDLHKQGVFKKPETQRNEG